MWCDVVFITRVTTSHHLQYGLLFLGIVWSFIKVHSLYLVSTKVITDILYLRPSQALFSVRQCTPFWRSVWLFTSVKQISHQLSTYVCHMRWSGQKIIVECTLGYSRLFQSFTRLTAQSATPVCRLLVSLTQVLINSVLPPGVILFVLNRCCSCAYLQTLFCSVYISLSWIVWKCLNCSV